jgi:uncharacterized protein (DUF305 family)
LRTRHALTALALGTGLLLGACSRGDDHEGMNSGNTSMHDMGSTGSGAPGSTTMIAVPEGAEFNATDVAFAQGMIPHHAQAIEMADMALEISTDADVTALAEQIKAAQGPEIDQMTTWLTDWDQVVPDPDAPMDEHMGGAGGMMTTGMMSEADLVRLGEATGAGFDRMFLEMMILHHEGAIEMAEQQLAEGKYRPTKDLAQAVITGQQAEIDEMNALIAGLPA